MSFLPHLGAILVIASGLTACRTAQKNLSAAKDDTAVVAPDACADFRPSANAREWLLSQSQDKLERVFDCNALRDPERIPVGIGHGIGTLYNQGQAWNSLQSRIGKYIWGGKIFMNDEAGRHLINIMIDTGAKRYKAKVYADSSIRDGKGSILLDYRLDDSPRTLGPAQSPAQAMVDKIAPGIRDEIREIYYQDGTPSNVFIGRAHIYRTALDPVRLSTGNLGFPISDVDFVKKENWFMTANFFLDFNPQTP